MQAWPWHTAGSMLMRSRHSIAVCSMRGAPSSSHSLDLVRGFDRRLLEQREEVA
jgi:hypothetical protein